MSEDDEGWAPQQRGGRRWCPLTRPPPFSPSIDSIVRRGFGPDRPSSRPLRFRSKEARRKLALQKLARVFGNGGGGDGGGGNAAERAVLKQVLRLSHVPEVQSLVRDRLSVISGEEDSSGDESDEEREARRAAAAGGSAAVSTALRAIARGAEPVPATLASGDFWEGLLASTAPELRHLRARGGGVTRADGGSGSDADRPHWPHLERRAASLRRKLRVDGYLQIQRPRPDDDDVGSDDEDAETVALRRSASDSEAWTRALGGETTLDDIAAAMRALRDAGWPPVAVYAFDAAWVVIDRLFEIACAVLGDEDVLLEPSCFAWALRGAEEAREGESAGGEVIGTNFPLPHRDYSAREAWADDADDALGSPNLLCVWMPVTDATLDSGCLYVVPRGSDARWNDPGHPDHLSPAEPEPGGGAAVHFPLAAARPMPAAAGSVCAWAGNTIHWGAACRIPEDGDEESTRLSTRTEGGEERRRRRTPPRHSLACTFRRRAAPSFCGSLPALSRSECAALDVAARVRLVAQSLVLYSRWYTLPPSLPGLAPATEA